jgi:hypothetical protein
MRWRATAERARTGAEPVIELEQLMFKNRQGFGWMHSKHLTDGSRASCLTNLKLIMVKAASSAFGVST